MINDRINGNTQIYGLIGTPIAHTFSPVIHNTIAKKLNHNIVYLPFHVEEKNLKDAIEGAFALEIRGLNVTIPHKKNVIPYLCKVDKPAHEISAVNVLKRTPYGYEGYNTDIIGLLKSFERRNIQMKDKQIVILGAGGSAFSAAIMAASSGAAKIFIVNRTQKNAIYLAENVKQYYNIDIEVLTFENISEISYADVLIQTTSQGFSSQVTDSPVQDKNFFKKIHTAYDVIYTPWQTKFLKEAGEFGCVCINGFDMLIYQAVASYEIWQNIELSDGFVEELREELEVYFRRE